MEVQKMAVELNTHEAFTPTNDNSTVEYSGYDMKHLILKQE